MARMSANFFNLHLEDVAKHFIAELNSKPDLVASLSLPDASLLLAEHFSLLAKTLSEKTGAPIEAVVFLSDETVTAADKFITRDVIQVITNS